MPLKQYFLISLFFFCSETLPNKLLNILRLHFIMNFKNMPKATLVECWHSAVPLKPSHGQTNCLAKKNLPGGKLGILSFPRKNTQKKKRDFIVCFCIYNSLVLLTCKDVHARNACILLVKISQFSLNTLPKQLPDIKIFIKDTSFQICLNRSGDPSNEYHGAECEHW